MNLFKTCPHCSKLTALHRVPRGWLERTLTRKHWHKCQCSECRGLSYAHATRDEMQVA
ncbi:hypothetical protein [Thaumasiovibrio subtropicus]|uniref:hypothetical protein n=1 Tax=Thaumasiovibrio subtropicus TaxID=1891207 RepID=UPI00131B81CD|nr:hypothetical protein [Thaumasiovibrio subtropicus]